ncbi:MAG: Modification methylase HaeIII [Phycisphaerae bacterium]|nr:Modification methylase HaeIII [Phycisphaerae bacterium]
MSAASNELTTKYRVISLFSGGMGLDLGLEATGRFEIIACVEKEAAFCETIRKNQAAGRLSPGMRVFEADINCMSPATLLDAVGLRRSEVDLVVGGPPCQSFSTAGKRRTVQDPRGTLLWQFLRFVEHIQPRFFLMENVRGLLSAALRHRPIAERPDKGGRILDPDEQPGSVVRLFAADLQRVPEARYHMDCFEVNAVNYGAPQIRERAIFIGNRYNAVVDFPDPTHGPAGANDERRQPANLFEEMAQPLKPWATLRDAIGDLHEPSPVVLDFSPRKKAFLVQVPPGSNWRSLPEDVQRESMGRAWFAKGGRSGWWRRLTFDLPCPTLVTMPNHASTSLCHPVETRALSIREYARVQEFPDDWQFAGTVAEQYAQVGNAVPVRLGRVAGDAVAGALDALAARNGSPYAKAPLDYRVVYVQSHVRTRQWYKDGAAFVWEDGAENDKATYAAPRTLRKVNALQ